MFAQGPDHGVQRVGDADDEGAGRMLADAVADRLHDLGVDADQVVAAHARLARHAGGDDHDIGAGDRRIIRCAGQIGVEAFDRRGLGEVQRLAVRATRGRNGASFGRSRRFPARWCTQAVLPTRRGPSRTRLSGRGRSSRTAVRKMPGSGRRQTRWATSTSYPRASVTEDPGHRARSRRLRRLRWRKLSASRQIRGAHLRSSK